MRGGVVYDMTSTCIQGAGLPRPIGGYQPTMMLEPHSPAVAWNYHSVVPKQEPIDEERNDSGINSGSDFHASSPGSDHSNDLNIPYTSPNNQLGQNLHQSYYSTPISQRLPSQAQMQFLQNQNLPMHMMYNEHPLTPPSSEPLPSPKGLHVPNGEYKTESQTTLTPCTSPNTNTPETPTSENSGDALRRLEMALEKNGLLASALSPKMSEHSEEGSKSDNEEEYDEQGLRIPKVNSHGKVKTFKCKQCDFVAITKLDFWEHTKGHIKTDKLLTCPKCPFVTEYKHHLEYHLRNHFGSKPFKCTQCNYSCVNKSMLNSHLKSHSNIYQYRCADCSYATKYCHSLKLHLRKYNHKPAMVLNSDGTPNPLPIIDVYGTRRGPKVKSQHQQNQSISEDESSPKPEQMLPFPLNQFMMNQINSPGQMQMPFPYPFFGAIPNPLLLQNLEKIARERQMSNSTEETIEDEPQSHSPEPMESDSGALDLSKPEGDHQQKSRRKGRAFKLTPAPGCSSDEEEDDHTTTMFSNVEVVEDKEASEDTVVENKKPEEISANNNNKVEDYSCQYCTINFGDPVLYTMHMGYHGYKNPFTCNMCGEECKDKVSFFLHIARTPHS